MLGQDYDRFVRATWTPTPTTEETTTMSTQNPREQMNVMARALCEALGVPYAEFGVPTAPAGTWYVRRCDTERPLYALVEASEHGGISHPLTSAPLTAQGLADALYVARLALAFAPKRGAYARETPAASI